jgi:hypothetical protein
MPILNLCFDLINPRNNYSFSIMMMSWKNTWELTQSYSSRHTWNLFNSVTRSLQVLLDHKSQLNHCILMKRYGKYDFIILFLYIDDMLIYGNGTKLLLFNMELSKSLAMKVFGPSKQIPGMKISCYSQTSYFVSRGKGTLRKYLKGLICMMQSLLPLTLEAITTWVHSSVLKAKIREKK